MKKSLFLLAAFLILGLEACSSADETLQIDIAEPISDVSLSPDNAPDEVAENQTAPEKILVAYFSWADNAVLDENVDAVTSPSVVAPGNVQALAGWVQQETDGDLFAIRVTDPYPSDWDACLARANEERGSDARPELAENIENFAQYDTIFLGYPNWWYGVPMALLSFLEQNDFSDKTVYLFCSHGTGGLSNSVEIISEAIPNAYISDQIFDCFEEEASSSRSEIKNWVSNLGF